MMNLGFMIFVVVCIQPSTRSQERSCSAILAKDSSSQSGNYTIDPDGVGRNSPFEVHCDMSRGGGVTVVNHDSESRTHVSNFNEPYSYRRVVTYTGTSLAQLIRLRSISVECTQFIEYQCRHSRLGQFAQWVTPTGELRSYWGTGSTRGTDICACSLSLGGCDSPRENCNCDINDHVWREDKGNLSFKADLPVAELRFGDTKNDLPDNEEGYHILGPFECFGQQDINDCDTNPCVNGGTCIDQLNDFQCNCITGYGGALCQIDINECDSNPCENGGTCTDKVNDFECSCPPGFEKGKTCQPNDSCGSYCILVIMLSVSIASATVSVGVLATATAYIA